METVVRRCPFLSRVPQAFLQKAGKSLLFYAQNCPKMMMEVGAKPAPRALSTSAVHCQQTKETPPADEKEKTAKAAVQQAPDDGAQLPSGHPSPATSQGSGSKCPFLAAQLSQTGSSVFRKASLELQEDVQEMHAVRKEVAQNSVTPSVTSVKTGGEDPSQQLKNFQDIMRKQRPERVSHLLQDNLPKSVSTFQYDRFFEKKIDEKKNDHTYRVFKTVNRRAQIFPMADDYTDSLLTKKQVSVWCSNDYLGMSRHPRVCGAVIHNSPSTGPGVPGLSAGHQALQQSPCLLSHLTGTCSQPLITTTIDFLRDKYEDSGKGYFRMTCLKGWRSHLCPSGGPPWLERVAHQILQGLAKESPM